MKRLTQPRLSMAKKVTTCAILAIASLQGTKAQSKNSKALHIGVVYPVSNHGTSASGYSNVVSFHLLGGLSRNENGFSLSGISNVVTSEARGVQIAGFSNHIHNKASGLQLSGFINTYKQAEGIQVAGFANWAQAQVKGAQVSGFANKAGNDSGAQVAGFLNRAKSVKGIQLS
ncbi:MAG TPA: hypothetical protein VD794_12585, partial [Flavisolibacter sp.]|nr:hypothetical protein [Flavisolibacter sp.]